MKKSFALSTASYKELYRKTGMLEKDVARNISPKMIICDISHA